MIFVKVCGNMGLCVYMYVSEDQVLKINCISLPLPPFQKNHSTVVRTKDLDSSLMVVSDSSEAVTLLLSNQIISFLNKNASIIEYIHLSDLYTGAARDR